MDFRRRRPSSQTINWVERVAGARVVAWRRMTGGISSAVHRLTIDHGGYRDVLVLRQYDHGVAPADSETPALVRDEPAATMKWCAKPAPRLSIRAGCPSVRRPQMA